MSTLIENDTTMTKPVYSINQIINQKRGTLKTSNFSNLKLFKHGTRNTEHRTQNLLKHFRHHAPDTASSYPFDGWDGNDN